MNEPRIYRHSPLMLAFVILIFGILAVALFLSIDQDDLYLLFPFGGIFFLVLLIAIHSMTVKTIISDDGISTQSLLGTKSLNWGEIHRASGRGNGIKLHNLDGDVTVAPSTQLPGYEEVVEWIGKKRPDLFDPLENGEMKKGFAGTILAVVLILLIFGGGALFALETSDAWFPLVFILFIGIIILATTFSTPQSVIIDGNSLVLKHLFIEKNLRKDEIQAIQLTYRRTRNGRIYFILLTLVDGKSIRLSGLNPSLPIAYLTLKNWLNKNKGNYPLFS